MSDRPTAPDQRTDRLGTERIGKLLLEFSIPAIVSMVFNTLYNVIDTAFLGQALPDGSGVAVTTLAFPVMTILMGFSMLAGQGGNALAAIQLGRGQKDQVERTLGNTATLLVGIALVVAIASSLLIDPILAGIGTTDELWGLTKTFIQIICFGFVFQSLGMGLSNFLRTAGRPILALGTMIFGTMMCIVLNHVVNLYGSTDPIGTTAALAAIGVAQKAAMFAITPLIGLIMGAQPIIGFNYGAKLWQRVLDTLKWASVVGVCIGGFFFLLAEAIPAPIVELFGVSGELEDFAVYALRVYVIFFAPVGFQIVGSSYFQSSGQPMKAAILELTRQVLFLIPLYLLLPPALIALCGTTGLEGVIISAPVSDALAVCVTGVFVAREVRKLRRLRDGGGIA